MEDICFKMQGILNIQGNLIYNKVKLKDKIILKNKKILINI